MKHFVLSIALGLLPTMALADGVSVTGAYVPLAPPKSMAHAAYMKITNDGGAPRQLVSVSAEGYAMAHIHQSHEMNGVATMSSLDVIEIAPGQTVAFAQGGLHVMLMRPKAPQVLGDTVPLVLGFLDGTKVEVLATVMRMSHGS